MPLPIKRDKLIDASSRPNIEHEIQVVADFGIDPYFDEPVVPKKLAGNGCGLTAHFV